MLNGFGLVVEAAAGLPIEVQAKVSLGFRVRLPICRLHPPDIGLLERIRAAMVK